MKLSRALTVGCVLALLLAMPATAQANRQFYGRHWQKQGNYYYKRYYYKPVVTAPAYRYSLVVYYPKQPRYYFYFNPYTKRYTGRFDREEKGYSLLPDSEQKETLAEIKPAAFPRAEGMPVIPGSDDQVKIEEPPPGLPPDETAELTTAQMQSVTGTATQPPPQQAYSNYCRDGDSYFCCYYYQTPAGSYHSHRCYVYPSRPRYVYYYNPYKNSCWGRYDVQARGYSLLAEKDRRSKVSEIPESAFPAPGKMPVMPEAKGTTRMQPPPAFQAGE